MRTRPFGTYALLLTLLLGQWLLVAHSFQHPLLSAPDQTCQICAHAPAHTGSAVAPPAPQLLLTPTHETPLAALPAVRVALAVIHYPIRAPPIPVR
ncbi:MAG: hypothetical protein ACRETE_10890 [Stenotrophobium sp.]